MKQRRNDPASLAVGVLLCGGGALLLNSLLGVWTAFGIVSAFAIGIAAGAEAQRRKTARHEYEQREWKRIVWEEWGYRDE